ncbi:hypothetical protein A9Q68_04065 [Streptococcus bovimastitidis]|uniref:Uncharacterized protein n=1 Tax=Streptococcus bovimastitidis TaxID=1856638 RepID=A0A1L8MPN1_9STRE|nr:hypothetical protein [Streptococcus bovimastitidis]OJF72730.1 hypothetical protein A9Q68_04065 [Streptococcus bovimastitidis]
MTITITCQARKYSFFGRFIDDNKLAIRLNKKYVSEIGSKETIDLEIPEDDTLLCYNFFDIPRIRVSNGDQISIKRNQLSFALDLVVLLLLISSIICLTFRPDYESSQLMTFLFSLTILLSAILPDYCFVKE